MQNSKLNTYAVFVWSHFIIFTHLQSNQETDKMLTASAVTRALKSRPHSNRKQCSMCSAFIQCDQYMFVYLTVFAQYMRHKTKLYSNQIIEVQASMILFPFSEAYIVSHTGTIKMCIWNFFHRCIYAVVQYYNKLKKGEQDRCLSMKKIRSAKMKQKRSLL